MYGVSCFSTPLASRVARGSHRFVSQTFALVRTRELRVRHPPQDVSREAGDEDVAVRRSADLVAWRLHRAQYLAALEIDVHQPPREGVRRNVLDVVPVRE